MGDIKVDANQWNGLSQSDRTLIESILTKNRLILADDRIVPTANASTANASANERSLCQSICDLAEAAAVQECNKLSGLAKEVCLIAAKSGGDLCRSKC